MRFSIWFLIIGAILLAIFLVRLPALTARTIHIDEGMGIRASELVLSGDWRYSPHNGHGPTLFYFGALIKKYVGEDILANIAAFRGFTSLCIFLSIIILWWFYKDKLNKAGQILLLLGLGFSSGLLFYGAYFIHEALFIFLTVITFLLVEHWLKTKRGIWLAFAIVSGGLMYMTKETAIFTYAAWILAGLIVLIFQNPVRNFISNGVKSLISLVSLENAIFAILGLLAMISAYFFFFGKNLDLIMAPYYWLTERSLSMHIQPWYYFGGLLLLHEFFLLLLGAVSVFFIALKKQWEPRILFFLVWFLFIFSVYSAIPYKTPWLIPNIILPLGLFTAFSISALWNKKTDRITKDLLIFIAIFLFIASLICLWFDNFIHPDRVKRYDYGYLQAGKGLREFTAILDGISELSRQKPIPLQIMGRGDELLYVITEKFNRQYAPFTPGLPAYINYFHSSEEMKKTLSKTDYDYVFLKFTYFSLGPDIDLFIRKDIWDSYKSSPNFIAPAAIWPDGTMRYD